MAEYGQFCLNSSLAEFFWDNSSKKQAITDFNIYKITCAKYCDKTVTY
jgi:hypothetical protein